MNAIEACRELVAIDSSTDQGTKLAAKFVANQAQQWGLQSQLYNFTSEGIENSLVAIYPQNVELSQPSLLMISTLETTSPGSYSQWVRTGANPFKASLDSENLVGLGIADAKADFVAKWIALIQSADQKFSRRVPIVMGSFGRESGSGAIRVVRKKIVNPDAVLVGGATDSCLSNCGPGFARLEIRIPFSSAERKYHEDHNLAEGSYSQSKIFLRKSLQDQIYRELDDNPILNMLQYLKKIPGGTMVMSVEGGTSSDSEPDSAALELDIVDHLKENILQKLVSIADAISRASVELKSVRNAAFYPEHSTLTVGQIKTMPDEVIISGVCRLVATQSRQIYEEWLESFRSKCAAAGSVLHVLDYKPPFTTNVDSAMFVELKKISKQLNLSEQLVASHRCSEANIFARLGVDCAVFGPGRIDLRTASTQESINVRSLNNAIEFYRRIIKEFCV